MCDEVGVPVVEQEIRASLACPMFVDELHRPLNSEHPAKKRKAARATSEIGETPRASSQRKDPSCDPLSSFLAGIIKKSFGKVTKKLGKISREQKAIRTAQKRILNEQEYMRSRVEELASHLHAPPSSLPFPSGPVEEEDSSSEESEEEGPNEIEEED